MLVVPEANRESNAEILRDEWEDEEWMCMKMCVFFGPCNLCGCVVETKHWLGLAGGHSNAVAGEALIPAIGGQARWVRLRGDGIEQSGGRIGISFGILTFPCVRVFSHKSASNVLSITKWELHVVNFEHFWVSPLDNNDNEKR
jgi:hypothetical protein